jgi:hypothetical protein
MRQAAQRQDDHDPDSVTKTTLAARAYFDAQNVIQQER